MNISKNITTQQLLEILMNIYELGQEKEDVKVKEVIDEIKKQFLSEIYTYISLNRINILFKIWS